MKKIILSILSLTVLITVRAQTNADTLRISRQQAMETGLKNRFDIQANQYNIKVAETNVRKAKNERLPEVNGSADVRYNMQLQQSVIPGGILPGYDKAQLVALGPTKNMSIFGISLQQPVFDRNRTNNIKIAENKAAQQQEKNKADEITIRTRIAQAYLDVLLKELQQQIAADNVARNEAYALLAEGKYQHGALIENDYLRIKLDLENAKLSATEADQQYALALMALKYEMNIPAGTPLLLTDHLGMPEATAMQEAQNERTEIRQLRLSLEEDQLLLKKTKQSTLPIVSLMANYSQQYLNDNFNYGQSKWWSPFSYAGIKLDIPLSAHFKNKTNVQEYKHQVRQHELMLEQKKADISYEVQQARTSLSNALLNMQQARKNYDLSQQIYSNQRQQFELGVFQYSDLLDTEKAMQSTEQGYIQSVYDYLTATINYQHAIAEL
ncbi:TolC family protein [Chitinophaga tropicalis]|uniref:Transporter n=1 Tax=Chitinophaga tropicalis TaxID=2683588 RepID=A0A7K1U4V2_9BACT|nr:TolC family protein [Chitinophaga tropicalis]MVT09359.1 hypothetical protein [Chitinophaga tropicalis]